MANSNPNNFKTTKEAMDFVRDFMNTPFDELVERAENGEEGYGIMTDPIPETNTQRLLNSIEDAPDYGVEEETLSDPEADLTQCTIPELKALLQDAKKPGICSTNSNYDKQLLIQELELMIFEKQVGIPNNDNQ